MRIGIFGSHCVGKTTLVNKLKKTNKFFNYKYYEEGIRYLHEKKVLSYNDLKYEDQLMIQLDLINNIFYYQNIITDRTPLDNFVYLLYYFGKDISTPKKNKLREIVFKATSKYDILIFADYRLELIDDNFRDLNEQFRTTIDDMIKNIFRQFLEEYLVYHIKYSNFVIDGDIDYQRLIDYLCMIGD